MISLSPTPAERTLVDRDDLSYDQATCEADMKALLVGAGQGRRLLPLTAGIPKCALPIRGRSILEWQLEELAGSGVDRVTVVVGFAADHVERLLGARAWPYEVRTLYNPFFALADNLVRSEEHTSELQSQSNLVCRLLLEKK